MHVASCKTVKIDILSCTWDTGWVGTSSVKPEPKSISFWIDRGCFCQGQCPLALASPSKKTGVMDTVNTVKPGQNKKGQNFFQLHRFLNTFLQLAAEKKYSKNGAAGNFFGPSYFVTALEKIVPTFHCVWRNCSSDLKNFQLHRFWILFLSCQL